MLFVVDPFEAAKLLEDAALALQAALNVADDNKQSLNQLSGAGISGSYLATGRYGWDDIDIVDDSNVLTGLALTNGECLDILKSIGDSPDGFVLALTTTMANVLPVPAGAISVGDFTCRPVDASQTYPGQAAKFQFPDLQITSVYTLFARGASYVTPADASKVDTSAQVATEGLSAFSQAHIRSVLQVSLRIVVLNTLQALYGLMIILLNFLVCF